jgi:hypothetical protein
LLRGTLIVRATEGVRQSTLVLIHAGLGPTGAGSVPDTIPG